MSKLFANGVMFVALSVFNTCVLAMCLEGKAPDTIVKQYRKTQSEITYQDETALETIANIVGTKNDGLSLSLIVKKHQKYAFKVAPALQPVIVQKWNPEPGVAIVGTALTLGLLAVFSPIETAKVAFGCSKEVLEPLEPDKSLSRFSGNFAWQPSVSASCELNLTLSADNGVSIRHVVRCDDLNTYSINLRDKIISGEVQPEGILTIECEECRVLDDPTKKEPETITQPLLLVQLAMSEAKNLELAALERAKLEKTNLEKAQRRAVAEKKIIEDRERQKKLEAIQRDQEAARKKAAGEQLIGL